MMIKTLFCPCNVKITFVLGCPATVKNSNGRTARLLAKDGDHKDAMKECRKAERAKPGKPGTELWAVRVRFLFIINM